MTLTVMLLSILAGTGTTSDSIQELDLAGWVSLALQNSPVIQSAEASLLSARASLTGDRSFLYPSLTASAGVSRSWSSTLVEGGEIIFSYGLI